MGRVLSATMGRLRGRTQPMTLRVKLGLMMLVPLLALLVFAGGIVADKLSDRHAAVDARHQAELVLLTGQLIHELQRERGLGGVFVNTDNAMAVSLMEQQLRTTNAYALFIDEVDDLTVDVDVRLTAAANSIGDRWERLAEHRVLVGQGALDGMAAMRPYTTLIQELLAFATWANQVHGETSALSNVHWDFLHAKERSALVRGTLATAARLGSLTSQERLELEVLVIEEDVYLESFVERAPRDVLGNYWVTLADTDVQSALRLREELLSGELTEASTNGVLVFDALTSHIEALLGIERLIVDEIMTTAQARESSATSALVVIGTGVGLLVVASFIVLALGARSIARPLRQLAESAQSIADGDLEAEPAEWPDDAIGEIGVAFEQMRAYLLEMATAAEELAWGNLEIEVEPRSPVDTFGHSIAAMTRRLSLVMVESELRADELEGTVQRLRASEEELRQTATHDGLTGLPNRAYFMDRLEVELERARRTGSEVGVAFIDLNKFKTVNDTLGHHAGDRLLEMVAERLRAEVRAGDTAARLGGDEFALILPDLHKEPRPDELLRRLVEALSVPYELHGKQVDCPPSVGVAFSPADAQGADLLLAHADHAMYEAKRQGGDAYRFWSANEPPKDIAV